MESEERACVCGERRTVKVVILKTVIKYRKCPRNLFIANIVYEKLMPANIRKWCLDDVIIISLNQPYVKLSYLKDVNEI